MSVDTTDPMTELHREIERLTAERDTANRERDDALNRLAQVQGMLTNLMARNDEYLQVLDQRAKALDAALARADKAERSAAELREALEPFGCETCKGTHLYTFEGLDALQEKAHALVSMTLHSHAHNVRCAPLIKRLFTNSGKKRCPPTPAKAPSGSRSWNLFWLLYTL